MIAKVAAGLFILASIAVLAVPAPHDSMRLKVLIRYDDYSRTSNSAIEEQLFEGVRGVGGRTLVGVIPYSGSPYPRPEQQPPALVVALGAAKLKQLKNHLDKGDITVALHGYSHQNNAPAGAPKSEFTDMPPALQSRLLRLGKDALESGLQTKVDVFVPPWDHYDDRLVGTLRQIGIHVLSSDLEHSGPSQDLQYMPGGSIPRRLKLNVLTAIQQKHLDGILVVTVHGYDFTQIGEPPPAWRANIEQVSVADLVRDLVWVANQAGVRIASLEELRRSEDLSLGRLEANRRLRASPLVRYGAVPAILALNPIPGLLYPRDIAESLIWKHYVAAALVYGLTIIFSFLVTRRLRRAHQTFRDIYGNWIALTLGLSIGGLALYGISQYVHIKLLAIALLVGAVFALVRLPTRGRPTESHVNP